jgi:ubiquinone/menaquinone biosynthesis C-methylase UbiE
MGQSLRLGHRILDFGCAAGRMIRWFKDISHACEIWGVDIMAEAIQWCQSNLSPPFYFVTTTSYPHLPFEDRYFDFIYSGSVFTHIADLADTWRLELKRILRPGGKLLNTVSDNHAVEILLDPQRCPDYWKRLQQWTEAAVKKDPGLDFSNYGMIAISCKPGEGSQEDAHVFYHRDYITKFWGRFFTIASVTPDAYGHQTAVLLEK